MLLTFAQGIASFFIQKGMLRSDLYDWYVYTLQRKITSMGGTLLLLFIGSLIAGFWNAFFFLQSIFLIRKRSGGYHAKTAGQCLLLSLCVVCGALQLSHYEISHMNAFSIVLSLCSVMLLWRLAPVNHPNLHLEKKAFEENKKRTRMLILLEFVMGFVLSTLLYTPDGSASQRFYTSNHKLFNELTASFVVGIAATDSSAKFIPINSESSRYYIDAISMLGGWKFELPQYRRNLGAGSKTSGAPLYFNYVQSGDDVDIWYLES